MTPTPAIRYVFFDALYTIIKPRRPIATQYNRIFASYLEKPIRGSAVEHSFSQALKEVQQQWPAYQGGNTSWWAEVVKRTALMAGGDPQDVEANVPAMTDKLMEVFRSKEGYTLYPDVIETLESLQKAGVGLGVVSNADARLRDVLHDLDVMNFFNVVVISEEEGIEKPSYEIWNRACARAGVPISPEVLHVGDELRADALGAKCAGLDAILLRRPGAPVKKGEEEIGGEGRDVHVRIAKDLDSVAAYVL